MVLKFRGELNGGIRCDDIFDHAQKYGWVF